MLHKLRIKFLSLSDESLRIRQDEKRYKAVYKTVYDKESETKKRTLIKAQTEEDRCILQDLHHHRVREVRPAARATHLARGFLAGMPYKRIESTLRPDTVAPSFTSTNWGDQKFAEEILRLCQKYGIPEFRTLEKETQKQLLQAWLTTDCTLRQQLKELKVAA